MSIIEELLEWRSLIDTPEKWIKGHAAVHRKENGEISFRDTPNCFCLVGARSTTGLYVDCAADLAIKQELPAPFNDSPLWAFNDCPSTTHTDIMALFDRAIAKEQAK